MLTKNDLKAIESVFDKKISPLNEKIGKVQITLDQKVDRVQQTLDKKIDRVQRTLDKKINKVQKTLDETIRVLDREVLDVKKRVDILEEHPYLKLKQI